MKNWAIEIKAGESVVVEPAAGSFIRLSEARLEGADSKKHVEIWVQTDIKFCIGVLSPRRLPSAEMVTYFWEKFEISHTSRSGTIHICGHEIKDGEYYHFDEFDDRINLSELIRTKKRAGDDCTDFSEVPGPAKKPKVVTPNEKREKKLRRLLDSCSVELRTMMETFLLQAIDTLCPPLAEDAPDTNVKEKKKSGKAARKT